MLDILAVVVVLGLLILIAYSVRNEEKVYESEREENNE